MMDAFSSATVESPNRELALYYARKGRPVFPAKPPCLTPCGASNCQSKGKCDKAKKPFTRHGFLDATTDDPQIRQWWLQWRDALVAMRTGKASGIAVLDLDYRVNPTTGEIEKDGRAWLAGIMAANGWSLPETVEVLSPSGGRHLWFQHEDGFSSTTNDLVGVDTRADGGYIIMPGTVLPDGRSYSFEQPERLFTIAKAPDFVAEIFRAGVKHLVAPETDRAPNRNTKSTGPWTGATSEDCNPEDVERALNEHWNPDSYEDWVRAALALHSLDGGFDIWMRWASRSPKFDEAENREKWSKCVPMPGRGAAGKMITPLAILARAGHEQLSAWATARNDARYNFSMFNQGPAGSNAGATGEEKSTGGESSNDEGANASGQSNSRGGEQARRSRFMQASELDGKPVPERPFLVPGWIPKSTVTLFSGDGGTGKSLVAAQLCVSTALSRPWLGMPVNGGRALFISAEDDLDEVHRRLSDIARSEQVSLGELDRLTIRSLAGEDALLAHLHRTGELSPTKLLGEIEQFMDEVRPDVVLLDTLADLFPGEENHRAQARQFIGMLRGPAIRFGAAVVVLAHPSLTGMSSGTGTSGSTGWSNSVRSRLYLERMGDSDVNPDARRLTVKKANYGRVGTEVLLTWRDGVFVANATENASEQPMASSRAKRVFLALLQLLTEQGRYVSPYPSMIYAPTVFSALPNAEGITSRAFHQAMELLLAEGKIVVRKYGPKSRERSYIALATDKPEVANDAE